MSTNSETVNVRTHGKTRVLLVASLIIPVLLICVLAGFLLLGSNTGSKVLTHTLSEPLGGATAVKVNIDTGDGNLTVDRITSGEPVLASGDLQHLENQGLPTRSVTMSSGQANFTVKAGGGGQPWLRLPWAACNGATEWQIHINPSVQSDITAHTDGGNVMLNLAGMVITRVAADTGGGNMNLVLPDSAANLNVAAKTGAGDVTVEIGSGTTGSSTINASSGAGNVVVRVPGSMAARIHASSGMGKAIVDARFSKVNDNTYQSADFDSAADKVEITVNSGAGNVSINTK